MRKMANCEQATWSIAFRQPTNTQLGTYSSIADQHREDHVYLASVHLEKFSRLQE